MFRRFTRNYSIKNIPHQTKPQNKYNAHRSTFNLKPVHHDGLIYNPPASAPSYYETPQLFLPKNDPRLTVLAEKYKVYTKEELDDMPLIYGIRKQKDYSLTPEVVEQIVSLRNSNPHEWTISKLAKKFNVEPEKVNVVTGFNKERQQKVKEELEKVKQTWSEETMLARNERAKRQQTWLRNDF